MSQVIYDSEWGVASKLKEKTGLTDRQIKSYRLIWSQRIQGLLKREIY